MEEMKNGAIAFVELKSHQIDKGTGQSQGISIKTVLLLSRALLASLE